MQNIDEYLRNRCGKPESTYYSDQVQSQNKYCGVTKWNEAGYLGKGVVVWDTEKHKSSQEHGCKTHDRVLDAAPAAIVLNASISSVYNNDEIKSFKVIYTPECNNEYIEEYEPEEFIKKFNVKIVTRSIGGDLFGEYNSDNVMDRFWQEMQRKYNLIYFNSFGNEGNINQDKSDSMSIYVQACHLNNKGKPERDYYSSTGIAKHNFIDFRGWDSGTSFSAPYLAGKTALLIERYGDLTQEQVIDYWKNHCEDLDNEGYDIRTGFGLPIFGDVNEDYFKNDNESQEDEKMKKFKDVPENAWYKDVVDYVVEKGYMKGVSEDEFKPDSPLTRAQLAQVLYNLDQIK